ncbi:hypothetical protein MUP29_07255 [bacterium]|nr:hypothetical protein [bacterium]
MNAPPAMPIIPETAEPARVLAMRISNVEKDISRDQALRSSIATGRGV